MHAWQITSEGAPCYTVKATQPLTMFTFMKVTQALTYWATRKATQPLTLFSSHKGLTATDPVQLHHEGREGRRDSRSDLGHCHDGSKRPEQEPGSWDVAANLRQHAHHANLKNIIC